MEPLADNPESDSCNVKKLQDYIVQLKSQICDYEKDIEDINQKLKLSEEQVHKSNVYCEELRQQVDKLHAEIQLLKKLKVKVNVAVQTDESLDVLTSSSLKNQITSSSLKNQIKSSGEEENVAAVECHPEEAVPESASVSAAETREAEIKVAGSDAVKAAIEGEQGQNVHHKQDSDTIVCIKHVPDKSSADPDKVKAYPDEVKADPNKVKANPDEVKADPNKAKANPNENTANPDQNKPDHPDEEEGPSGSQPSLSDELRAAAESVVQQSGYVYDQNSGMYYDHNSGYYYSQEKGLFYDPRSGTYFFYNSEKGEYEFHSQVDLSQTTTGHHGYWQQYQYHNPSSHHHHHGYHSNHYGHHRHYRQYDRHGSDHRESSRDRYSDHRHSSDRERDRDRYRRGHDPEYSPDRRSHRRHDYYDYDFTDGEGSSHSRRKRDRDKDRKQRKNKKSPERADSKEMKKRKKSKDKKEKKKTSKKRKTEDKRQNEVKSTEDQPQVKRSAVDTSPTAGTRDPRGTGSGRGSGEEEGVVKDTVTEVQAMMWGDLDPTGVAESCCDSAVNSDCLYSDLDQSPSKPHKPKAGKGVARDRCGDQDSKPHKPKAGKGVARDRCGDQDSKPHKPKAGKGVARDRCGDQDLDGNVDSCVKHSQTLATETRDNNKIMEGEALESLEVDENEDDEKEDEEEEEEHSVGSSLNLLSKSKSSLGNCSSNEIDLLGAENDDDEEEDDEDEKTASTMISAIVENDSKFQNKSQQGHSTVKEVEEFLNYNNNNSSSSSMVPSASPCSNIELSLNTHSSEDKAVQMEDDLVTGDDMGTAGDDVGTTGDDVGTAGEDMGTAGDDMGTAGGDMGTAGDDMGTAGDDMGTAGGDIGTTGDDTALSHAKGSESGTDICITIPSDDSGSAGCETDNHVITITSEDSRSVCTGESELESGECSSSSSSSSLSSSSSSSMSDVEDINSWDNSRKSSQSHPSEDPRYFHGDNDAVDSDGDEPMEAEEEGSEDLGSGAWPPCIRVIVMDSNVLDPGSLIIVTCSGATVGREKDQGHIICIPDLSVSKHHATICYDQANKVYTIQDVGSQNGTFVNEERMSQAKTASEAVTLSHADIVQFGCTRLLLHIHPGLDTCDECEPGLVQAQLQAQGSPAKEYVIMSKEEKMKQQKHQLKQIKKKYGLQNAAYEDGSQAVLRKGGYEDKAAERRRTKGSDNPYQKDEEGASVHVPIGNQNKGKKLLQKMGWTEGESLGKHNSGIQEPISVTVRSNTGAGLGSLGAGEGSMADLQSLQRSQKWMKAKQRFADSDTGAVKHGATATKPAAKEWIQGETEHQ